MYRRRLFGYAAVFFDYFGVGVDYRKRYLELAFGVSNKFALFSVGLFKRCEKLFADNGNLVSGPVIAELEKMGISHKNGEEYLLPAEIVKRNY